MGILKREVIDSILADVEKYPKLHTLPDLAARLENSSLNETQWFIFESAIDAVISPLEAAITNKASAALVARHLEQLLDSTVGRETFISGLLKIQNEENHDNVLAVSLLRLRDFVSTDDNDLRRALLESKGQAAFYDDVAASVIEMSRALAGNLRSELMKRYSASDELKNMIDERKKKEMVAVDNRSILQRDDVSSNDRFVQRVMTVIGSMWHASMRVGLATVVDGLQERMAGSGVDISLSDSSAPISPLLIAKLNNYLVWTEKLRVLAAQVKKTTLQATMGAGEEGVGVPGLVDMLVMGVRDVVMPYATSDTFQFIGRQLTVLSDAEVCARLRAAFSGFSRAQLTEMMAVRAQLPALYAEIAVLRREFDGAIQCGELLEKDFIKHCMMYFAKVMKEAQQVHPAFDSSAVFKEKFKLPFDADDKRFSLLLVIRQLEEQCSQAKVILNLPQMRRVGYPFAPKLEGEVLTSFDPEALLAMLFDSQDLALIRRSRYQPPVYATLDDLKEQQAANMQAVMESVMQNMSNIVNPNDPAAMRSMFRLFGSLVNRETHEERQADLDENIRAINCAQQ